MKVQMLKVGEPDKDGQREYLFTVYINREPTMYQVRARHEQDAQQRLRSYVEADAAGLQELGGVAGAGTVLLVVGAVGAAIWAVRQHVANKKSAPLTPQAKRPAVINGAEVSAVVDDGEADGAPADSSSSSSRSFAMSGSIDSSASSSAERMAAAERAAVREATSAAPIITKRPILYNGIQGTLAGTRDSDPSRSIRIVVFSDRTIDPLLSLARPSSYDAATGRLRDAIVLLSFPASAATMQSQNALEVFIGDSSPRKVDVQEASAEAALASIRNLLGGYL